MTTQNFRLKIESPAIKFKVAPRLAASVQAGTGTLASFNNNAWVVSVDTNVIATQAFVLANGGGGAVSSVFGRTGAVVAANNDYTFAQIGSKPTTLAGYGITDAAPLASPVFTGNPTAPTPSPGDNDTSIATTAFVATSFAPLASPTFTGIPAAPTAAFGTNTTQLATTAFVQANSGGLGRTPTTSTVTISNASPGVVTWTSHGLALAAPVFFETTGTLPTGLTAAVKAGGSTSANNYKSNPTLYYAIPTGANTFTVATTIANAIAGTAVNTSSAGSGTHTAYANAMVPAGFIGEMIWNAVEVASPVAITSAANTTWNSISVPAGIWEFGGNVGVLGTSGTVVFSTYHSNLNYGLGNNISTVPYDDPIALHVTSNDPNGFILPYTVDRHFLTTTTTVNAVVQPVFSGGTAGAYGKIWAQRVG